MIYFQVEISVERYFSAEREVGIFSQWKYLLRGGASEKSCSTFADGGPYLEQRWFSAEMYISIILKLTRHWVQKIQVWGPHMMAWEGHSSRRVRCSLASELRSWLRVLGHHKMVWGHRTTVWGGFCFLYHDSWSDLGKEWMVWLALIHQRY